MAMKRPLALATKRSSACSVASTKRLRSSRRVNQARATIGSPTGVGAW